MRGYAQKSNTKSEILVEISLNIYLEIKIFKKLFSILYYNMNTNLLDLDDDILNIIGDYVKMDNAYRIEKEKDFEEMDKVINYLKENNKLNKYEIKESLYSSLFKKCYEPEDIKEYVISRKLKRYIKNFNLSMRPNAKPYY